MKARFVEHDAPQAEWRMVHRLADAVMPRLARQLTRAFHTVERDTVWPEVVTQLERYDAPAATAAVKLDGLGEHLARAVVPTLFATYLRAGDVVARQVRRQNLLLKERRPRPRRLRSAGFGMSFDETNPYAQEWARTNAGRLITQVTDETRFAVREIINEGFAQDIPPRELARQIRQVVGLTSRGAAAVSHLRSRLEDAGLARQVIDRRVEFAAARALRDRSLLVARTEVMAASNTGQLDAWRVGRSEGLIDTELVKEFIVTPDDRLCPRCEPLDGEQVAVDEAFSFGSLNPPVHPACRCAVGLASPRESERLPFGIPSLSQSFNEVESPELLKPGKRKRLNDEMRRLRERHPSLSNLRANGLFLSNTGQLGGGAIGSYSGNSKRIRLAIGGKSLSGKLRMGEFNLDPTVTGTLRHEFGHFVHYEKIGLHSGTSEPLTDAALEWRSLWKTRMAGKFGGQKGIELTISEYASTNERELFAESFSAFTHPDYTFVKGRSGLPPDIHDFMVKHIGVVE